MATQHLNRIGVQIRSTLTTVAKRWRSNNALAVAKYSQFNSIPVARRWRFNGVPLMVKRRMFSNSQQVVRYKKKKNNNNNNTTTKKKKEKRKIHANKIIVEFLTNSCYLSLLQSRTLLNDKHRECVVQQRSALMTLQKVMIKLEVSVD